MVSRSDSATHLYGAISGVGHLELDHRSAGVIAMSGAIGRDDLAGGLAAPRRDGGWTVTSLVPSGEGGLHCTSGQIGSPVHHSSAVKSCAP